MIYCVKQLDILNIYLVRWYNKVEEAGVHFQLGQSVGSNEVLINRGETI